MPGMTCGTHLADVVGHMWSDRVAKQWLWNEVFETITPDWPLMNQKQQEKHGQFISLGSHFIFCMIIIFALRLCIVTLRG